MGRLQDHLLEAPETWINMGEEKAKMGGRKDENSGQKEGFSLW